MSVNKKKLKKNRRTVSKVTDKKVDCLNCFVRKRIAAWQRIGCFENANTAGANADFAMQ